MSIGSGEESGKTVGGGSTALGEAPPEPPPSAPEGCPQQVTRAIFYVWSGNEIIEEIAESNNMAYQYVYANGMRIAQLKNIGSGLRDTTYLHSDYQGSTRLQTDRLKTITAKIDYDAWGLVRQQTGTPSAYTYTGQEWDDDNLTNLFYLNARYYDPKLGRFTTPDPLPSDLNPYSYCNNNPAMLTDVSGMVPGGPEFRDGRWQRQNKNGQWINMMDFGADLSGSSRYAEAMAFKRNVLGHGGVGRALPIAVQAGMASARDAWLGNAGLWVLLSADGKKSKQDVLGEAITAAHNAGDIGDALFNSMQTLLFSGNLIIWDDFHIGREKKDGAFSPSENTVYLDGGLSLTVFAATFAKEAFHWACYNGDFAVIREAVGPKGSLMTPLSDLARYQWFGPLAWMAWDNVMNEGHDIDWARRQWERIDNSGGAEWDWHY